MGVSRPSYPNAAAQFAANTRSIEIVRDQLALFHDEILPELMNWIDPENTGDQDDARARLEEAVEHLGRAVGSIEDAQQQLQPQGSEGERGVPAASHGTSTPQSPSENPYRLMAGGRRRLAAIEIIGPVDEPGYKGYKLFANGRHIETHERLRDACASAAVIVGEPAQELPT